MTPQGEWSGIEISIHRHPEVQVEMVSYTYDPLERKASGEIVFLDGYDNIVQGEPYTICLERRNAHLDAVQRMIIKNCTKQACWF